MAKKKRTKTTYVKGSGIIGFHEWNTESLYDFGHAIKEKLNEVQDAIDKLDPHEVLKKMFKEGFEVATKEYAAYAYIDIGKTVTDPLVVRVGLPIGEEEYEGPQWKFDLDILIANEISGQSEGDGTIAEEAKKELLLVRDKFRQLADQIDEALSRMKLKH